MRRSVLVAVAAVFVACGAPVRVTQVSPRVAYEGLTANVLTAGRPSEPTRNVLRRHALLATFDDDPDAALDALHAIAVGETGGRRERYAMAELSFLRADQTGRADRYLAAAAYAWAFLFPDAADELPTRFDPRARVMCDVYNLAVARAFQASDGRTMLLRGGTMPLPFGTLALTYDAASLTWDGRRLTDVESTADVEVEGLRNRYRLAGLGAPAAAAVEGTPGQASDLLGPRARVPITVLLRFTGPGEWLTASPVQARLEVHVQNDAEWTDVAGERVPLESELTATLADGLVESQFWRLEIVRFFGRLSGIEPPPSLVASAPHRTGAIPVVFVHGTASSPGRWADMMNDLWSERYIRAHFEPWMFSYDTGNPVVYSARALRRALTRAVEEIDPGGHDPCLRRMIVVGHSQGGLLAKMTAIDTGDRFWSGVASRPFEELELPEPERELVHEMMFLEPLPFVGRVVFIATPHGGSYQALRSLAGFVASFVSIPGRIMTLSRDLIRLNPGAMRTRLFGDRVPNSINDMTPGSPFQTALRAIPVAPGIPAHSIIAVAGDGPVETGSDGVVEYESAHLDDVASEVVVRSGHSTQGEPATIQEVNRILRLHVGELGASGIECGRADAGAP